MRLKYFGEAMERRLSVSIVEVNGAYMFSTICFIWFVSGQQVVLMDVHVF